MLYQLLKKKYISRKDLIQVEFCVLEPGLAGVGLAGERGLGGGESARRVDRGVRARTRRRQRRIERHSFGCASTVVLTVRTDRRTNAAQQILSSESPSLHLCGSVWMQQAPAAAPLAFISIECAPRATHRQHAAQTRRRRSTIKKAISLSGALQRERGEMARDLWVGGAEPKRIHTLTKRHLLYLYDWHQKPSAPHTLIPNQPDNLFYYQHQQTHVCCLSLLCVLFVCLYMRWQLKSPLCCC